MIRLSLWDRDLEASKTVEVDYISFITDQTYGAPPLIAPTPKNPEAKRTDAGEQVAYINPRNVGLLVAYINPRLED